MLPPGLPHAVCTAQQALPPPRTARVACAGSAVSQSLPSAGEGARAHRQPNNVGSPQEALRPVDLVKDWQRGIRQTLQACANRQRPPRQH